MLNTLQLIFQSILDVGAEVFMPMIIIVLGLIFRMKIKDAISSGIYIGIAFVGVNLVVNYLYEIISPVLEGFVSNTGLSLTAVDLGWTATSTVAWSWPYIFLIFPIQIGINMLMLALKKTDILNVDMWNVWQKGFLAAIIYGFTGNIIISLIAAAIGCVTELYIGEAVQDEVEKISGAPGVTCPHWCLLLCAPMYLVDQLLCKIPVLNKDLSLKGSDLHKKLGIFSESHIIGFIIGTVISLFGGYSIFASCLVGIQLAACLVLLPMAAKLFMTSMAPFGDAAVDFMKKYFPGRELVIGLDWPIMAGSQELWITCILLVPVFLGFAIFLPGNIVMPMAGIMCAALMSPAVLVTGGNILRSLILGVIFMAPNLWIASYFARPITDMAVKYAGYEIEGGTLMTRFLEGPVFTFGFSYLADGHILGLAVIAVYFISLIMYVRNVRQKKSVAK